jgi:hypothetical protein
MRVRDLETLPRGDAAPLSTSERWMRQAGASECSALVTIPVTSLVLFVGQRRALARGHAPE